MGFTYVAFEGFEVIAQAGDEAIEPRKNLPKAMIYSVFFAGTTYVIVGFESYKMQPTLRMKNRWEAMVPVPAEVNSINYHFKVDYEVNEMGKVSQVSKLSRIYTLEIIETDIHRLAEVDGIGAKRVRMIAEAWEAQKQIKEIDTLRTE